MHLLLSILNSPGSHSVKSTHEPPSYIPGFAAYFWRKPAVSVTPPSLQPADAQLMGRGGGDFLKEPRFVFVKMKTKTISKYYPEQLHLQKEHQSTSKKLTLVRKKGQKALKDSFTFCESVVILFRRFSVLTI